MECFFEFVEFLLRRLLEPLIRILDGYLFFQTSFIMVLRI